MWICVFIACFQWSFPVFFTTTEVKPFVRSLCGSTGGFLKLWLAVSEVFATNTHPCSISDLFWFTRFSSPAGRSQKKRGNVTESVNTLLLQRCCGSRLLWRRPFHKVKQCSSWSVPGQVTAFFFYFVEDPANVSVFFFFLKSSLLKKEGMCIPWEQTLSFRIDSFQKMLGVQENTKVTSFVRNGGRTV